MPTTHDYYAILEVEPDADVALIKSQYRKLVRLNHPDISPDKDSAHARMQNILEAYTVLSDVEKRDAYDRARQNRSAAKAPVSNASSSVSRPTPRPMPRPTPGNGGRPYGGAGRAVPSAYGGRGPARPGIPAGRDMVSGATNTRARLLTMVFDAANLYFEDGRAPEAIAICERVMKADASNAEAPALLGDIYTDKGRNDLALLNYERAVRLQPHNLLYRQKWEGAKQPNSQNASQGKGKPIRAAKGGCGGKAALWVFVIITAATPFLILYFGGP